MHDLEYDQSPPWNPSVPPDEETFGSEPAFQDGHRDAFAGRCVHGVRGARFIDNRLVNPKCEECQKDLPVIP